MSSFGPGIKALGCSTAMMIDDLLNGNVTKNGSAFFTGLNTFANELNNLNNNFSAIDSSFADLNNPSSGTSFDALAALTASATEVQQIPAVAAPHQLVLNYNSPVDGTTGSTSSTFIPVLGDYTNSSSLVGALYTVIDTMKTTISDVRTNAGAFRSTFASVASALTSITSEINGIVTSVNDADTSMESSFGNMETAGDNGNMALQAFYGVFVGFSAFALLGALLTVCCDKYGCRYLMYFSCVFLFLAGIIGFFIATILSIFIPPITWGCSYLDVTLGSEAGFTSNYFVIQPIWTLFWELRLLGS